MAANTQNMNIGMGSAIGTQVTMPGKSLARMVAALFGSPRLARDQREDLHDFNRPQNQKNYLSLHQNPWQ